jgi:hypothetical protein
MISNSFPVNPEMSSRGLPVYSARDCFNYAYDVVKGRWKPGEASIVNDPECAADYYNEFYDQFTEYEQVLWLLKI